MAALFVRIVAVFALSWSVEGAKLASPNPPSDVDFYKSEIAFLAHLGSRVTGTANHNKLIDHIQWELEAMGLQVHTDVLNFTYNTRPPPGPKLSIGNQVFHISAAYPYSGNTNGSGLTGQLVDLTGHTTPNWTAAAGRIAVANVSNNVDPVPMSPLYPDSPPWPYITPIPAVRNPSPLSIQAAAAAGVKAVIWKWDQISTGNAEGQYVPFTLPYQGIPSVFVAGSDGSTVLAAARSSQSATLSLSGTLIPDTKTRTIWVVFKGTTHPNESVIINTHTDGTNAVEENGHIALLHRARHLLKNPPQRTTVLVFVSGHMRIPSVTSSGQATTRWLQDHPEYWNGSSSATALSAVAGSCVEHLGAKDFHEDIAANSYILTNALTAESLYAATDELNSLTRKLWNGAQPNVTRVIDPNILSFHPGEGGPLWQARIPDVSLITTPTYLLAEFGRGFDETTLVDVDALKRQVDSFMAIWDVMDTAGKETFGVVPATGG